MSETRLAPVADQSFLDFDIVFFADFRSGDTDVAQAGQVLNALVHRGYQVGVLSIIGNVDADPFDTRDFRAALKQANLHFVAPESSIKCRLLLAFDLRSFTQRPNKVLSVDADKRMVLCRRANLSSPRDLAAHLDHCRETLGGPIQIAPIAPPIRSHLLSLDQSVDLTPEDWLPTISIDNSRSRSAARRSLPVIGFGDRRWPKLPSDIDLVLPHDPRIGVVGIDVPEDLAEACLARESPFTFLAKDDFRNFYEAVDFIATAQHALLNPWPEQILAGLALGVVPVLPPEFRPMFYAAAVYARPENVGDKVIEVWGSSEYFDDLRLAARELIQLCLAPEHLIARTERLIGPPAFANARPPILGPTKRTVLSLSSNGVGMGHLSRQIAIARKLPDNLTPVFLSFSQAVSVVEQFGWVGEYLPYHEGPKIDRTYWNLWLADALEAACNFYEPAVLVLDANLPFDGIGYFLERRTDIPVVWIRRGMWGRNRDIEALDRHTWFQAIFEPGELAEGYDHGPTLDVKQLTRSVAPVRMVDRSELPTKIEALAKLGLQETETNALLLPGALNNTNDRSFWQNVASGLLERGVGVTIGAWKISESQLLWPEGVRVKVGFPFAKWMSAFDFAVSTAGYNSFHELTHYAVPTVFVPNENPLMDRQDLRAKFACRNGIAKMLRSTSSSMEIGRTLDAISDLEIRFGLSKKIETSEHFHLPNGAKDIAAELEVLANSICATRQFN